MERRVTTQDISWFLDLNRNKQLDTNPSYQRKSVWSQKDRKSFLDTIWRGYPCPAIFLHKTLNDDGKQIYHIVDGKQRLETVIKFVNDEISIDKEFGDSNLNGKKWKDIDATIKKQFWDYVFSVEFINTIEGSIINEVFDRLNRNARKLERQEIRHARFDGWFSSTIETEAAKEEWVKLGIVTKARARRMKDFQFLSELLIITITKSIIGFDQDYIDEMYANYDNLSDLNDFSEDDILENFEATKNYILKMQEACPDITKYIKSLGNMYSLWAFITITNKMNDFQDIQNLAKKYLTLMDNVSNLEKKEGAEFDVPTDDLTAVQRYQWGAKGAITDKLQRDARHQGLLNALRA